MRKLKPSGVEWLGDVPEGWEIRRGKFTLSLQKRPVADSDEVITCFRDGEVTLRKNRREDGFTFSLKEIGYQGIEIGDLVIHGMDGFAGAIGISDSKGKASPVLVVCDSSQNKRFLVYYLRSMAYNDVFTALATGIRVRSCDLRWNKIAELPFILPPLPEQNAVTTHLDTKCTQLDALVANEQGQIEKLKQYRKSLITEAVSKGLDSTAPTKPSGVEWLEDVPERWDVAPVKRTSKFVKQKCAFPSQTSRYIGLENVESWTGKYCTTDSQYDISQSLQFEKGDILFGKLRPYLAKVYHADNEGLCSSEFCVIRSKGIESRFCFYCLLSEPFINVINATTLGTKMPRTHSEDVENTNIPIPSLSEQRAIAEYLDTKCAEIDALIAVKEWKIAKLGEYKKALIYECVTGKREVI